MLLISFPFDNKHIIYLFSFYLSEKTSPMLVVEDESAFESAVG